LRQKQIVSGGFSRSRSEIKSGWQGSQKQIVSGGCSCSSSRMSNGVMETETKTLFGITLSSFPLPRNSWRRKLLELAAWLFLWMTY
jgi:hypothetical protein